jgi:hypothetical protein
MVKHLGDLTGIRSYSVRIEFTERFEPSSLSGQGLPLLSVKDEIEAQTRSLKGLALRRKYGRIPYGAALYLWESEVDGRTSVLYVGQTMLLKIQKRFEGHAAVIKLLADHVNRDGAKVFFRLCSRLDLKYEKAGVMTQRAIEHFPLKQARRVVSDLEAYIIFQLQPAYNSRYKGKEKAYHKPFEIDETKNIQLPMR